MRLWCADLGLLVAAGAIAYLLIAIRQVGRFRERRSSPGTNHPAITVLVPVHGSPARLYECLRSCCEQDYPRFQVVFGLHSADDPGRVVIERVQRDLPALDSTLVIDSARIGTNPKVCNLANMYASAKHDLIVMVDSDVEVEPGFLRVIAEPFGDPALAGATCLYRGGPEAGWASRLGAFHIDDWIIPSAIVDLSLHPVDIFFGAVMAVRRGPFEAAGGFGPLASAVAEDDVLGGIMRQGGHKLALSSYVVKTTVAEKSVWSLLRHELRWMRSVRSCRPLDHFLSMILYPLVPCALLLAMRPSLFGAGAMSLLVGLRVVLSLLIRRRLQGIAALQLWMLPLRDALSFAVWLASFASWSMVWNAQTLVATPGRRMAALSAAGEI